MINILNVIKYEDRLALEYETVPGYPQTIAFPWDSLLRQLPPDLKAEVVKLAALLLKEKVAMQEKATADTLTLAEIANNALHE